MGLYIPPVAGYTAQKPDVGNWQVPLSVGSPTSGTPGTAAALLVWPLVVTSATRYDRFGYALTTQQATAAMRGGIYGWNGGVVTAAPLISDLGALDLSSGSGTVVTATIALSLPVGNYWFANWIKDAATQVTGLIVNSANYTGLISWDSGVAIASMPRALRLAAAYPANMPSTLPSSIVGIASGNQPICMLRVSA